jgi:GNAT superfamily N-acetyltransferase
MFYFPNTGVPTPEEAIPTPLRPGSEPQQPSQSIMNRFFWVEGENGEDLANSVNMYARDEIQKHVRGKKCANIQNMCVRPGFQNQSIGAAMMTWACQRFDEKHLYAYLEASVPGERLYRKFGFHIAGHSDKDFGPSLKVAYSHMWRTAGSSSA